MFRRCSPSTRGKCTGTNAKKPCDKRVVLESRVSVPQAGWSDEVRSDCTVPMPGPTRMLFVGSTLYRTTVRCLSGLTKLVREGNQLDMNGPLIPVAENT